MTRSAVTHTTAADQGADPQDHQRASLQPLKAEQLEALFNVDQTHARPQTWIARIMETYPVAKDEHKQNEALNKLVASYFPNVAIGYDPAKLRAKLKTFKQGQGFTFDDFVLLADEDEHRREIKENARITGRVIEGFLSRYI